MYVSKRKLTHTRFFFFFWLFGGVVLAAYLFILFSDTGFGPLIPAKCALFLFFWAVFFFLFVCEKKKAQIDTQQPWVRNDAPANCTEKHNDGGEDPCLASGQFKTSLPPVRPAKMMLLLLFFSSSS
jgi:hypothetical protein